MAGRIRTIKPEVLDDELACALTDLSWRVWVSLWVLCDDFGNVRASPKYLAAQIWQDTARVNDAVRALEELSTKTVDPGQKPMIFLYGVDGQTYAHIKGFDKHQRQDNRSKKPRVPSPPEGAEDIQDLRRHLAAKIRKSPRGKSVCTAPPRNSDPDHKLAALTSEIRDPTADHRPPTTDPISPAVSEQGAKTSLTASKQEDLPASTRTPSAIQPESTGTPEPAAEAKPKTPHQIVKECYVEAFAAVRHEQPPFGSQDGKAINTLLDKVSGDAERACGVIRSAFGHKYWRDRVSIQTIALDPARYCNSQLSLSGVLRKKDPSDWVPTDDPAREEALRSGPREGKAF